MSKDKRETNFRKLIEQEKADEEESINKERKDSHVPFCPRQAWWGILALLATFIFFVFVSSIFAGFTSFPAPFLFGVLISLLYVVIFLVAYYFSGYNLSAFSFNKFPFFRASAYVVLFFIATLAFEFIWLFLLRLIGITPPNASETLIIQFGRSIFGLIVIFLLTVVIAPIVEEIFFRSFLFQAYKKGYGTFLGILISALLFALFHFSFLVVVPVFFVIGVFLAYIFEKFESVYPAIMLHALNNLFFFIGLVLMQIFKG